MIWTFLNRKHSYLLNRIPIVVCHLTWSLRCLLSFLPDLVFCLLHTSSLTYLVTYFKFNPYLNIILYIELINRKYRDHVEQYKLFNQLNICSKIVGQTLEKLDDSAYYNNLLRLANNIVSDPNHILHNEFELLPSNRRYRVPRFHKVRLKHSFEHQTILELNKKRNQKSRVLWTRCSSKYKYKYRKRVRYNVMFKGVQCITCFVPVWMKCMLLFKGCWLL